MLSHGGPITAFDSLDAFRETNLKIGGLHGVEEQALQDDEHGPAELEIERADKVAPHVISSEKPEKLSPPENRVSPLRHYMSLMGSARLFVFAFLIVLHIGCNTAQRELHPPCQAVVTLYGIANGHYSQRSGSSFGWQRILTNPTRMLAGG